jgi:hypothetical protein
LGGRVYRTTGSHSPDGWPHFTGQVVLAKRNMHFVHILSLTIKLENIFDEIKILQRNPLFFGEFWLFRAKGA